MENEDWITGKIKLKIDGRPFEMEMTVPKKPVKPQRMLPIFQQMASSFVGMSVEAASAAGREISCKAGCGACCRQAVPISEIELFQIAELVETMEEPRRSTIKQRFADGNEHFRKIGWYQSLENCAVAARQESREKAQKELEATALEYFYQNIPCPFLENESCSIHEVRPLVCREYLVVSPAENCAQPTPEIIEKVVLLTQPSKPLMFIARTQISENVGFIPLISALDTAQQFPENFPLKTGQRWAADFFEQMAKTEIPTKGIKPKAKPKAKKRQKKRIL